jgi:nitrate reductase NapE component
MLVNENWLDAISIRIRPEIAESTGLERASQLLDTSGLIGSLPIALIGVFWLIGSTDLSLGREEWLGLAIIFILLALFSRYTFELRLQLTKTKFATNTGSLEQLISWSGALMFGPIALWPDLLLNSGVYAYRWWQEGNVNNRWNIARNYVQDVSSTTIARLLGLTVYGWLGGVYPLAGLSWAEVWPAAIVATLVYFLTALLLFAPFGRRIVQLITISQVNDVVTPSSVTRFLLVSLSLSYASLPFAILAAGLYGAYGFGVYLFFVAGAFLASLLANRLSQSDRYSQQRSKELATLESLGRAIIDTPPDDSAALPQLLADHIEGMFLRSLTHIWLYPDTTLYQTKHISEFPQLEEARALAKQGTDPY